MPVSGSYDLPGQFAPFGTYKIVISLAMAWAASPGAEPCRDTRSIASSPSGMVQKYARDGSALLFQIGTKGVLDSSDGTAKGTPLNSNAARFFMPSSLFVDPKNGE